MADDSTRRIIVVGVGASAGGLPALKIFLDNMPVGHRLALVLVQHLDPHAESMMARLLADHSGLRVAMSKDGARVEADHVYTLPPGKQIRIEDGMLKLSDRPPGREGHFPIDAFLASLAEDQEEDAIAVILTGSGTDGTKGVREIKAHGGVVFAQDPDEAEQPGMPESAIATGAVDVVANIASLPERIIAYASHMAGGRGIASSDGLGQVIALMREHTGMDFSGYKEGTLGRRVHRRIGLRRMTDMDAYMRILQAEPAERELLRKDILIGVTSFFRDEQAFAALEENIIPRLFADRDVADAVRVWVPGCSTGEEAYSVAMLLLERREAAGSNVPIRVFATDANEDAIEAARAGVYSDSSLSTVPMERIARFFEAAPSGRYTVAPRLREVVTFATQDLVVDPPLPKLDLICCRNVLIYLTPNVQRALLNRFHFSLKPSGYLFLGRTESVPQDAPFEPVVRRWRIFRRSGTGARASGDFTLPSVRPRRIANPTAPGGPRKASREESVADLAQGWLLQKYAPAAVVIDQSHQILSFHGSVDTFLNLPRGEPVLDLLAMPKEGLRSQVRTAVYRAAREQGPIRVSGALPDGSGGSTHVEIHVEPLRNGGSRKPLFIVAFLRVEAPSAPQPGAPHAAATEDEYVRQIEDELRATKSDLEETVESSQNHYEELQAANEEVTSMNEELRAANEELMASKEELQALNEEVTNAHDELQAKFEALRKTTDDLDNILVSTNIATLFVDREFRIIRSTPALARLMNVRPGDSGRPLGDITWRFEDPDFLDDAKGVLESLAPSQKEVRAQDGHRYQRRIVPYRTREDRIEGVLVTFENIEDKRRAEEAVQAARAYAEGIVATIREPLVILDQGACVVSANPAFYARFHLEPRKTVGSSLFDLGGGRWDVPGLRDLIEHVLPKEREIRDYELTHALDDSGPRKWLVNGRRLPDGDTARMLLAIEDAGPAGGG